MNPIEYLVTGAEMQRYDANTIEHFKVPGIVLMEQAALSAVTEIVRLFPETNKSILVLSGKGNNGGDAMAVARLLTQKNYSVTVSIITNKVLDRQDFSESAAVQYDILKSMNVPLVTNMVSDSYDIIIDGIFGVGLNREITGMTATIIKEANLCHGHKIALDIPSGIDSSTGTVHGTAFKADYTITFAFLKRGLYLYPGASYCGTIVKKEIGITSDCFLEQPPEMFALTGNVKDYLPVRSPWGHKGTFGKVFLIAGSKNIGGAAILAGKASMMCGCGMLKICTHKEQKSEILTVLPEAMIDTYDTPETAAETVMNGMVWADVIAIGPGIDTNNTSATMLETVIKNSTKPLVMDADALNLLAKSEYFHLLKEYQNNPETRRSLVLTPHPLELARILGVNKETIMTSGLELTKDLACELQAVIVKKDARTIICSHQFTSAINLCGNSGMATAGSGDVLTGIIAALLAMGLSDYEAGVVGVYLHAKAGDLAAYNKNEYSMLAGDICESLISILK